MSSRTVYPELSNMLALLVLLVLLSSALGAAVRHLQRLLNRFQLCLHLRLLQVPAGEAGQLQLRVGLLLRQPLRAHTGSAMRSEQGI